MPNSTPGLSPPSYDIYDVPSTIRESVSRRMGRQYLASIICNIGVVCFGTALGWSIHENGYVLNHPGYSFVKSSHQWDMVRAFLPFGTSIGCIPMGILMKEYGCKPLMLYQFIPCLLGWGLLIFAKNVNMLYLGRFLQGICGAAVTVAVPVYTIEISSLHNRGAIGSIFFAALMYGISFSTLMMTFFSLTIANACNMCLTLLGIGVIVVPESPTHYIFHDKFEKAKTSLIWLHSSDDIGLELRTLVNMVTSSSLSEYGGCSDLCSTEAQPGFCRALFCLIVYQACGGVAILGCLNDLLNKLSDSTYQTYVALVVISVITGHLISFMLIDRVGIRTMLLISSSIMVLNGLFLWTSLGFMKTRIWVSMFIVWMFFASFSSGFGPISWILHVQLISEAVRPYGCSISAMISWFFVLILTIWEHNGLGSLNIFFVIMIFSCLGLLFALLFLPETKGLTTVEIQTLIHSYPVDDD